MIIYLWKGRYINAKSLSFINKKINIANRVERLSEKEAFINLKDHKPNFVSKPTCRLICPTSPELGVISKSILSNIVKTVASATDVNLWKSTHEVLNWFREIPNKNEGSFINFDIVEFYPSITEDLLINAMHFAQEYTVIEDQEKDIIIHAFSQP